MFLVFLSYLVSRPPFQNFSFTLGIFHRTSPPPHPRGRCRVRRCISVNFLFFEHRLRRRAGLSRLHVRFSPYFPTTHLARRTLVPIKPSRPLARRETELPCSPSSCQSRPSLFHTQAHTLLVSSLCLHSYCSQDQSTIYYLWCAILPP